MTIVDDKLYKILKKVYCKKRYEKDENGYNQLINTGDVFDSATRTINYSLSTLTDKEKQYLNSSGYPLNEVVGFSHDECIREFKKLIEHPYLSMDNLLAAYIAGFSSFPRGRQPILSYLFAKAVPEHSFSSNPDYDSCIFCSIRKQEWIQKGYEIFRRYWGYSWNELWGKYVVELQDFLELPPCVPTEEDIQIFRELISLIRNAPAGETPGKLEERVRKSKIILGYEKYRFRGQLMTLAELGVMPNAYVLPLYDGFTSYQERYEINLKSNLKSDIILPLAGWSGDNPIDEERLKLLFGKYLI